MKIFLAGATGAIGRELTPMLVADGHEVVGMTRSSEKSAWLKQVGAQPLIADAYDFNTVTAAMRKFKPHAVIDQLTDLPPEFHVRDADKMYRGHLRLRREGSEHLLASAVECRVEHYVSQSVAFLYEQVGAGPKTENDSVSNTASGIMGEVQAAIVAQERKVLASPLTGLVLRYGFFYGPGTWYSATGSIGDQVRKRKFPIAGPGSAVFSFVHVHDAATATLAAVNRRASGIYNIVDNEPIALREWLPLFAREIGASPPRSIPLWLARLAVGPQIINSAVSMRGASNTKAREELGWSLRYESVRDGFAALGKTG